MFACEVVTNIVIPTGAVTQSRFIAARVHETSWNAFAYLQSQKLMPKRRKYTRRGNCTASAPAVFTF